MSWMRHFMWRFCRTEGRRGKILCLLGLWVGICLCPTGQAVIIATGNGSGNTTAPSDDLGWNYVGRVNTRSNVGSGVYLGGFNRNGSYSHWVLTAAHIGDGDFTGFTMGSSFYSAVPNSLAQIRNPTSIPGVSPGLQTWSTYTDLAVFQITVGATNNLPASRMPISAAAPALGSEVVGIGLGRNRQSAQTAWDSGWIEVSVSSTNARYKGWKYGSGTTKRWGKNRVENLPITSIASNLGGGDLRDVKAITTDFDESGNNYGFYGAVTDEFQASPGDSGGGLFYKNGSAWELTGIFTTIELYLRQPNNTVMFGTDTHAADLSFYRDNILAVIPESKSIGLVMGVFALAFVVLFRRFRPQRLASP